MINTTSGSAMVSCEAVVRGGYYKHFRVVKINNECGVVWNP